MLTKALPEFHLEFTSIHVCREQGSVLATGCAFILWLAFQGGTSFVDHLCYLCLVFVMLSRLFIAASWSPAGKGLAHWLSFVMFNCVFVTFLCGIGGQVWYLIVSIPDLCLLSYFSMIDIETGINLV